MSNRNCCGSASKTWNHSWKTLKKLKITQLLILVHALPPSLSEGNDAITTQSCATYEDLLFGIDGYEVQKAVPNKWDKMKRKRFFHV
ncbi:MAG: hypothetical protein ACPGVN_04920 [Alphaproteobacteria bacterium]